MKEKYCKFCDFSDLNSNEEWYCEYWNCPIGEVEHCNDRLVDGM